MNFSKWIEGLAPGMRLQEAARLTLDARLGVVRHYLPLAVNEPFRDLEHVHQLRVGTRRAAAALRTFQDCLPGAVYRKARNCLRRIRRAAGGARDWDVFQLQLLARINRSRPPHRPGLHFLFGQAHTLRRIAQERLVEKCGPLAESPEKVLAEATESLRQPEGRKRLTLADLAHEQMKESLDRFDEAASADLDDHENLHKVRIAGKRMRYVMEIIAPCYKEAFRAELYPTVEAMQDILGAANDSYVAAGRIALLEEELAGQWPAEWQHLRAGIEGLRRLHERRLPRLRERFTSWWQNWEKLDAPSRVESLLLHSEMAEA